MRTATNSSLGVLRGSASPAETPKTGSRAIRSTRGRRPTRRETSSPAVDSLTRQSPPAFRTKSLAAPAPVKTGRVSPRRRAESVSTSNRVPSRRAIRYRSCKGPSRPPAPRGEIRASLTIALLHEEEILVPQAFPLPDPAPLLVVLEPGMEGSPIQPPLFTTVAVDQPARARDRGSREDVRLPAIALEDQAFGRPAVHLAVGDLADLVVPALVVDHPHLTTSSRRPTGRSGTARDRTSLPAGSATYRIPP